VIVRPLLHDGRLRAEVHPALLPSIARWLPLVPPHTPPHPAGAVVRILPADAPAPPRPDGERTLAMGDVDAWMEPNHARLAGASGVHGIVSLAEGTAELRAPADGDPAAVAMDLFSASNLWVALLLGRMGRALAHAAAVAPPGGGAWLLVGDSRAGKTTTCANLVSAGWNYLSDDHVVLFRDDDGRVMVEGLPRPFHLDEGWEAGGIVDRRGNTDPHQRWPGAWRRTAPLAGLLFPGVAAAEPTALAPMRAPDALAGLLRQSPWLLADRAAAPAVLALLREAALFPAHRLHLGLDTYADPPLLAARLGSLRDGDDPRRTGGSTAGA
jgi:hypothetical protein